MFFLETVLRFNNKVIHYYEKMNISKLETYRNITINSEDLSNKKRFKLRIIVELFIIMVVIILLTIFFIFIHKNDSFLSGIFSILFDVLLAIYILPQFINWFYKYVIKQNEEMNEIKDFEDRKSFILGAPMFSFLYVRLDIFLNDSSFTGLINENVKIYMSTLTLYFLLVSVFESFVVILKYIIIIYD